MIVIGRIGKQGAGRFRPVVRCGDAEFVLALEGWKGELVKFNPYHLGPGDGGGSPRRRWTGRSSGAATSQGNVTNLSAKEILDRAKKNRGWLHPKSGEPSRINHPPAWCSRVCKAVQ